MAARRSTPLLAAPPSCGSSCRVARARPRPCRLGRSATQLRRRPADEPSPRPVPAGERVRPRGNGGQSPARRDRQRHGPADLWRHRPAPGADDQHRDGLISGTPSQDHRAAVPHSVTATVNDGRGGNNSKTFKLDDHRPFCSTSDADRPYDETNDRGHRACRGARCRASPYHVFAFIGDKPVYRVNGTMLVDPRNYTDTTAPALASSWYRVTSVAAGGVESPQSPAVVANRRIQLVATTTTTNNGATIVQIAAPTPRQVNDLMLATITVAGADDHAPGRVDARARRDLGIGPAAGDLLALRHRLRALLPPSRCRRRSSREPSLRFIAA